MWEHLWFFFFCSFRILEWAFFSLGRSPYWYIHNGFVCFVSELVKTNPSLLGVLLFQSQFAPGLDMHVFLLRVSIFVWRFIYFWGIFFLLPLSRSFPLRKISSPRLPAEPPLSSFCYPYSVPSLFCKVSPWLGLLFGLGCFLAIIFKRPVSSPALLFLLGSFYAPSSFGIERWFASFFLGLPPEAPILPDE